MIDAYLLQYLFARRAQSQNVARLHTEVCHFCSRTCMKDERTRIVEEVKALKRELARRQEDHSYTQQLHDLTLQEQDAASRLAYERLLADKSAVDIRLDETEASPLWLTIFSAITPILRNGGNRA